MALGLNTESTGGDFLPIIKYDSRAGRIFRVDRADGISTPHDITAKFKAVVDFEHIEVGYINFATGGAPDFVVVPLGEPMPQRPSVDHKQGFRLTLKLGKESGGDVRELASVAKVALQGIDDLHNAYEAGKAQNAGKLPVIALKDVVAVTTEGKQKTTNYKPVFEILQWVPRPEDLHPSSRAKGRHDAHAPAAAPPSTGSTRVDPPAAQPAPQPAMAMADDLEDFG